MISLALEACGSRFLIRCADPSSVAAVLAGFGGLSARPDASIPVTVLGTVQGLRPDRYRLVSTWGDVAYVDATDLMYCIDKHLTLALQQVRQPLYFLHAAAVAIDGRAALLAAPSGTGKSTLALALVARGARYLSDELAPVDLGALAVWPYPRALRLKSTIRGIPWRRTRAVLPLRLQGTARTPHRIHHVFFLRRDVSDGRPPGALSAAAAATNLMANALNPLAHPRHGLSAAVAIGRSIPCSLVDCTDTAHACAIVIHALTGHAQPGDVA